MKKLIIIIAIVVGFVMPVSAFDFQSGSLLYTIITTDPPCVSLDGHIEGSLAQGELVIPETVEHNGISYTVTSISRNAFYHCQGLVGNLVIPNTVTQICIEAFSYCTGFTGDLVIPNAIIELGTDNLPGGATFEGAFEGCSGFTRLVLGDSLEIIGCMCFYGCSGFMGPLVLPDGLREIWVGAFEGCSAFTGTLTLPDSLTFIGNDAFLGCGGFTGTMVIPENVETIESGVFSYCTGIEEVTLPQRYVFYDTYNYESVLVFAGCTSLTSVRFPEGWETTGKAMFAHCSNIVSVQLPESLLYIGNASFHNCSSLSEIKIPKRVIRIERDAFCGCTSLTDLSFPKYLAEIGREAFSHCFSLSGELIIPNSVETIYPYAFDSCYNITRVVLGRSTKHFAEESFRNIPMDRLVVKVATPPSMEHQSWQFSRDLPVIVPCGTLEAYRNAEGWSEFTNITEGVAYDFVALSEDEDAGFVNILKEATCEDMTVEVEAVPKGGGSFYYWEANGEVVSSENPYSFTLEGDTRLVAVFSTTGVGETEQSVSVYPNPAREKITIEGAEASEVQVFNALGQVVKTVQNTNEVSLEGLPQGVYLLRVRDAEGTVFAKRVTICR